MVHITIPADQVRCSSYMGWHDTMQFINNLNQPILTVRGYDIKNLEECNYELDISHFWDIKRSKSYILTEMLALLGVVDVFQIEY